MILEELSDPIVAGHIVRLTGALVTLAGGIFDLGKIDDNVDVVVHGVTEGLWNDEGIPEDECLRDGMEEHVFPDIVRRHFLNALLSAGSTAAFLQTFPSESPVDELAQGISIGTVINGLLYMLKSRSINKRFPSYGKLEE